MNCSFEHALRELPDDELGVIADFLGRRVEAERKATGDPAGDQSELAGDPRWTEGIVLRWVGDGRFGRQPAAQA